MAEKLRKPEEEIFYQALEKTPDQRKAYLAKVCGDNQKLHNRIEALLKANELEDNFLQSPMLDSKLTLGTTANLEEPGMIIGRYKLLEKIGEGGMAMVYMAEQEKPIRRKVALKIIKLGMDTKSVIARFEAERQALALMDHPNIAKVLDAGATETGRPYFVMDLVPGLPITEYSDKNRLNIKERLKLFISVCNAVQHAHQKGIIHRDIKPSNIIVTQHDGKPVPKVIDFGIAKATNQKLTEKTLFTRHAHIIGTPAYMSPEQAELSDLEVDTRTDIYSLGILLYELLTGSPPFSEEQLRHTGYLQMQKIICEEEPTKPSTKLSTLGEALTDVAQWHSCSPELLPRLVRGDLDWIVMKSLEKERNRRYETVHELIGDTERHLRNEPIMARSPGILYCLQKFVRRHRARLLTAAVMILAVGLVITTVKYWHTSRLEWAKGEALPRIVELVQVGEISSAFPLAQKLQKVIPNDPALVDLWPRISKTYSINTTPEGAQVFYREYEAVDKPWQYLGQSPLKDITLANVIYRWKFEKQGFNTHECVIDRSPSVRLCPSDLGREMVWIEGWQVELPGDSYTQSTTIDVPVFWIDKYEVTNEQFQTFVNAGGYTNADYWEGLDFIKDGLQLSWQEAMGQFRDQTDQPGPFMWEDGTYPQGQERYPVSGVSWFEAMAYARFSGKSLPTLYHWRHAACLEESTLIVGQSNFAVGGTAVVGSYPGMGYTGLYDMAGNVKEWCFNATDDSSSQRYILGGSFGEPTYQFWARDLRSPWHRTAVNGFRCVKYSGGIHSFAKALLAPVPVQKTRDYATSKSCSAEEYSLILRQFKYDKLPLVPEIVRVDDSAPLWREETITFNAAYGVERVIAHLFLPKTVAPPYQVVVYWPETAALEKRPFTGLEQRDFTEIVLQSRRALMFPIYQGTYERSFGRMLDWYKEPHAVSDWVIHVCKDMCRSIDYLETRHDINTEKIAYYGVNVGGLWGPMALAVEDRFKAGILVAGGFLASGYTASTPAIDPLNHAPRVKVPVLMINGEDDSILPYETSQRPMYEFLGIPEADKKHKRVPGGQGLLSLSSLEVRDEVVGWLDRYLGPVEGKTRD
jgi:serine/threonine protein kinase/formylglycine-generating enzyme required for sulfatase activity/dienelactone hydrolase